MKKFIIFTLVLLMASCTGCKNHTEQEKLSKGLNVEQMHNICQLATMECYYHNVAKSYEENAGGFLGNKDKRFWVEYSGVVTLGIDASLVTFEENESVVTVTIPEAKILGCNVTEKSIDEMNVFVDKNSVKITSNDQSKAFEAAQAEMKKAAAEDKQLLNNAQERAKTLVKEYVDNMGEILGKHYEIEWVYVDENGSKADNALDDTETEQTTS